MRKIHGVPTICQNWSAGQISYSANERRQFWRIERASYDHSHLSRASPVWPETTLASPELTPSICALADGGRPAVPTSGKRPQYSFKLINEDNGALKTGWWWRAPISSPNSDCEWASCERQQSVKNTRTRAKFRRYVFGALLASRVLWFSRPREYLARWFAFRWLETSLCIPPIWSYSDLTSLQVFPILVLIVSLFVSGQEKYGFEVSIVVNGVKIVYVPLLPGHSKRLDQKWVNLVYFQLRHGKMKQFPSCCQSENKEIQVPLGWPTVIVFADSWSTVYRRADGVVFVTRPKIVFVKLDAESIFPLWWSCLDSNHSGGS